MSAIETTVLRPFSRLDSPMDVIRHFTPNWFAVSMGTGILATTLAQFPDRPFLFALGEALWLTDMLLFSLFTLLYGVRWLVFFHEARRIVDHSVMSMFLGCIPMALATIGNGFLIFGIRHMGQDAITIATLIWHIDGILAAGIGIVVPFLMFTRQTHAIEQMTAIWLLPIVACGIASISGALLVPHIADAGDQLGVLLASYALWALSIPLAMSILAILFLRMAIHKLPPAGMASTCWLALGPIGTGSLAMLLLGACAPAVLRANGLAGMADAVGGASLLAAVLFWGYGLWWLAAAILITIRHLRIGLPFNLGWWAYVFPLGIFTTATLRLGSALPVPAIGLFGGGLAVALAALWLIVSVRTLHGAWHGTLFFSPCLRAAT